MTQATTPLRQRMIDDMRLRKLAPKTQSAYLLHVRRLAAFLHRPPDTATGEDLRRFQLHMVEQGFTLSTLNVTIAGLKFFFEVRPAPRTDGQDASRAGPPASPSAQSRRGRAPNRLGMPSHTGRHCRSPMARACARAK